MASFKCKMCGGALEIVDGETVAVCEYCGTKQTLPRLGSDHRAILYDRANHFRRANDYDKAEGIYNQILNEDNTDAEAYWGLVLCRFGIEYVEDPTTNKRVPTVNRTQATSIFADEDYKSALYNADILQKEVYEAEAKAIDEIQRGILAISQKEEPFDVFICYKESDADGRRTRDSVLANDLYHELTEEGFKVFFAKITLEDKLGSAYEPYIFAALNSAKVMVVLGTKPEYFNAVWVKNEWSRYLALIKKGEKKKLIPAYRDMDPYDLPEEFSHLQAQDMSKLGFMQDLIRGIKKIIGPEEIPQRPSYAPPQPPKDNSANVSPLLKRVSIFLSSQDWKNADIYCEKVLDIDPENSEAYVYKLLAQMNLSSLDAMENCNILPERYSAYQNAVRFADMRTSERLIEYNRKIKDQQMREQQRRQEKATLESKRNANEDNINQLKFKRNSIEQQIQAKENEIKNFDDFKRKKMKAAKTLLVWSVMNILSLFLTYVLLESGSDSSAVANFGVICILTWIVSFIACIVQMRKMKKNLSALLPGSRGGGLIKAILILMFFTIVILFFGVYCFFSVLRVLLKSKKETAQDSILQLNTMRTNLQRVIADLADAERTRDELDQQLQAYR